MLKVGDRTALLKAINKQNDRAAVGDVDRGKLTCASPGASSRANAFEAKAKFGDRGEVRMSRANTLPIGHRKVTEPGVREPSILNPEDVATRSF
jgi:hypothetical protein